MAGLGFDDGPPHFGREEEAFLSAPVVAVPDHVERGDVVKFADQGDFVISKSVEHRGHFGGFGEIGH